MLYCSYICHGCSTFYSRVFSCFFFSKQTKFVNIIYILLSNWIYKVGWGAPVSRIYFFSDCPKTEQRKKKRTNRRIWDLLHQNLRLCSLHDYYSKMANGKMIMAKLTNCLFVSIDNSNFAITLYCICLHDKREQLTNSTCPSVNCFSVVLQMRKKEISWESGFQFLLFYAQQA